MPHQRIPVFVLSVSRPVSRRPRVAAPRRPGEIEPLTAYAAGLCQSLLSSLADLEREDIRERTGRAPH